MNEYVRMAEEYAKAHIVQYPKRVIISENGFCTSEDEVKQAFLAGLKADRPQWHDLEKDPNDLPKEKELVLMKIIGGYILGWYDNKVWCKDSVNENEILHSEYTIAWCEIPTFDKE